MNSSSDAFSPRGRSGRFLSFLTLLIMLASLLAACGTDETINEAPAATAAAPATDNNTDPAPAGDGAPFTIGVSNGFVGSEWRTQMLSELERINEEYKAAGLTTDLIIESADVDVQGQIQQIRNLINRDVDAIIINPNSQTGLNGVIEEATEAGIVVIAVDQEISAEGAINVVIDQTEWARMSTKWMAEELGGAGDIVIINGIEGHPANEARYNGVKEVLAEYPNINVLNVGNANWDQATGQQIMSNFLASQPNIDAVWTQDGMAQGVLQAIESADPAEWPLVVGEARAGYMQLWNSIAENNPEFTSFGVINPPAIGASGLRVAVELLQGRQFKAGTLQGPYGNSLYVPIPGVVSSDNFAAEFEKIKDQPASYVVDGMISEAEAKAYFQ